MQTLRTQVGSETGTGNKGHPEEAGEHEGGWVASSIKQPERHLQRGEMLSRGGPRGQSPPPCSPRVQPCSRPQPGDILVIAATEARRQSCDSEEGPVDPRNLHTTRPLPSLQITSCKEAPVERGSLRCRVTKSDLFCPPVPSKEQAFLQGNTTKSYMNTVPAHQSCLALPESLPQIGLPCYCEQIAKAIFRKGWCPASPVLLLSVQGHGQSGWHGHVC